MRIVVSGSYGGSNLGDEAILQSILTGFRRSVPDAHFTVFSADPTDTVHRHYVDKAVRGQEMTRGELVEVVDGADLFVLGGGGILFDKWVSHNLREARTAQERGVPVVVYAVGVGPLADPAAQEAVTRCLNASAAITVRDWRSYHELERLDVLPDVVVTADPAVLLEPEPLPENALEREGLSGKPRIIGMSVREPGPAAPDIEIESYHAMLANAADYMVDRFDADIVFVPMEPAKRDVQHSHAVIAHMFRAQRATVLKGTYTSGQILSLVGHFSFAVGMRLHFLLFAALQSVPFVALPYASKVTGLIEDLDMETPPLTQLTTGRLLAYIDRSWDRRDALRRLIERGRPSLQDRSRRTLDIALDVLGRAPSGTRPVTAR